MLSGSEILFLLLLVLCVTLLSRFFNANRSTIIKHSKISHNKLNRKSRLYIFVSLIWPIIFLAYTKLWINEWTSYFLLGIGPIILFWGIHWIKAGKK